jgi:diguanylate cyclase (GGDEF)-like protein
MAASSSLTTHTDPGLVALSITIAIAATYLALDLTRRSADTRGWRKRTWIMTGGVTMGVGIWSMHFIGMLALRMSMPVSYNGLLVALSLLVAVLGASVSLAMVTRPHLSRRGLLSAAAFMGFAVASMHYLGMASMQMPAAVHWNVALVVLSVVIGLVASLTALSLLVRIRESSDGFGFVRRVAAAVLLGFGVAGLHYTAMQASTFTSVARSSAGHGFTTASLVVLLAVAAGVMLAVLIGGAALDQRRAALASDIAIVANIARDLCRVGDARGRICLAVQQLTGADHVSLLEPDEHGKHSTTASTGVPNARASAAGVQISDGTGTVHCENLGLDGRHVGLLAVGWNDQGRRLSDRTATLLEMVAAEAAVAIDRVNLLSRLEELSRHDELTGLVNRRVFNEELERELLTASRHDRPLCVVMLDIDHFKTYNDTRGHQAGDRLLASAAAAWRAELRATDVIARYGGEEFVVILPECDLNAAVAIADRLREVLPGDVTCCAGVATLKRFDTATRLVGRADEALYRAKASGRDQTVAFTTSNSVHDVTALGVTVHDITALDVTTQDLTAQDLTAQDLTAQDLTAQDLTAQDVTAHDVSG